MTFDLAGKKVWVAGHRGMVGSALVRRLKSEDCEILTSDRPDFDLIRQEAVHRWFELARPHVVVVAAARVGGIGDNAAHPVQFLWQNLMIAANVIHYAAVMPNAPKLLFLGSSCIYPREAPQPMKEEYLLTGPLEPTNEWYAIAKITGIKLCQAYRRQYGCDFISCLPTNLYGPGDRFDPETGHVIPALMTKMHQAKMDGLPSVKMWGSGMQRREFMHVDDCADACVHLLKNYSDELPINIGWGYDLTLVELASIMLDVVGYAGAHAWDLEMPDGPPRKLLDCSRLDALGWQPKIDLKSGLRATYEWYRQQFFCSRLCLQKWHGRQRRARRCL